MKRLLVMVTATVFVATVASFAAATATADGGEVLSVMGFGSCNKHDKDQGYWPVLTKALTFDGTRLVDAFAWLGDVVYADRSPFPGVWVPERLDVMEGKLTSFRASAQYADFVDHVRPVNAVAPAMGVVPQRNIYGVWDDHDMGKNDGGKEYNNRHAMQQYFLDFLGVPKVDPRRSREGLYSLQGVAASSASARVTKPHGPANTYYPFNMCVLLLDGRFHRDAIGSDGDMLGDEQWQWLEKVLRDPRSDLLGSAEEKAAAVSPLSEWCAVTIIGSGVQVLGDEKPTEHWGHFPKSRDRLMRLLYREGMERFVFISGDVHYAEIQVEEGTKFGFPVADITSSGLTHSVGGLLPPWLFDIACATPRRRGRFLQQNFGSVVLRNIDGKPSVSVRVHDVVTGAVVLDFSATLAGLSRRREHHNVADDGDLVPFPIHSGLLKTMLWNLREAVFPSMPVHRLLTGFIAVMTVGLAIVGVIVIRLILRMGRHWIHGGRSTKGARRVVVTAAKKE